MLTGYGSLQIPYERLQALKDLKASALIMSLAFEPLSLAHQGLVDDFFRRFPPQISEFTFTNLFIWRHYYQFRVSVVHDFLTLLGQPPGSAPFLFPPLGEGRYSSLDTDRL